MKQYIAQFFSIILHPLLMPFYGMILIFNYSYLAVFPFNFKLITSLSVLLFTGVLPAISITLLYKFGKISSIGLNVREDRPLPYLICLLSYLFCGVFLYKIQLPLWVIFYVAGGLASILIDALVNIRWKISAHLTGIGGLVGTAFALSRIQLIYPMGLFIILILLTGALGTSRIALNRHTLMQVAAGTANGFICIYTALLLAI